MPASNTDKGCVPLLSIESEDHILNDLRFLGCLCQSNYPLLITIRFMKSDFQTTYSPSRSTEVIAFNQFNFFSLNNVNRLIYDV